MPTDDTPNGLPAVRHLARRTDVVRPDGKPLYVTRCHTARRIARLMGTKDSLPYYASAYCGPYREGKYTGVARPDGRPLLAFAAPCCGGGSGSGSVSGSGSLSGSGSVSGSASGSVSGSVGSRGSVQSGFSGSGLSGSGPPKILVECCDRPVSTVLYATFGGTLSPFGTVVITYDQASGRWYSGVIAEPATCQSIGQPPTTEIAFRCADPVNAQLTLQAPTLGGFPQLSFVVTNPTTSCDPFLFSGSATASSFTGSACAGTASVVVTDTPP